MNKTNFIQIQRCNEDFKHLIKLGFSLDFDGLCVIIEKDNKTVIINSPEELTGFKKCLDMIGESNG